MHVDCSGCCLSRKNRIIFCNQLIGKDSKKANDELAADVRSGLEDILKNTKYYSIAIDSNIDGMDTCQLAVLVRGTTPTFDIVE